MINSMLSITNTTKINYKNFFIKNNLKGVKLLILLLFILTIGGYYICDRYNTNNLFNNITKFDQFLMNNGFKVENIIVSGTNYLPKKYIIEIVNQESNVSIFNINLSKIYNQIVKNSWVKEGYVERILPSTIKIKISEKIPIAIWQNKTGNKLVTKNGNVISPDNINNFSNKLPIVKGKKAKDNIFAILEILNTNKDLAKNIWSLTFINQRRWDLRFNQGLIVKLPSVNVFQAWQKISKLQKEYNILDLKLIEIDLRNPKQILGKINFDKSVILKRKNL